MLINYLRTALRGLTRAKTHALINIAGLSIGMAVALLIGLWIADELSFNKNFGNYDRIAQVYTRFTIQGGRGAGNSAPVALADELRAHYGGNFRQVVMSTWNYGHLLAVGTKVLNDPGSFMEPGAPNLLTLRMLEGTRDGLKKGPAILLSQTLATALFGSASPMGKTVRVDNQTDLQVTGVYEDLPDNSSFGDTHFIGSWEGYLALNPWVPQMKDPWRNNSWQVFVEIAQHADFTTISSRIRDAKAKNVAAEERNNHYELFLHPMSRWHLYSDFGGGYSSGGQIKYVRMFCLIGVFVLLLACINFMNLSTARSERRAREVGIRKAIGGLRFQLITQFYLESFLLTILAFAIAVLLASLALGPFNELAGKAITMPWGAPLFWGISISFCLLTGLISGSYPALYLSSFRPVKVLKGAFKAGRFAALPRQALVILQFTVSVSLIVGTIVVFRQIQYAKDRPVGYERDRLVMIPRIQNNIHQHFDAVRNELKTAGAITEMAESSAPVTDITGTNSGFEWPGKDPNVALDFPNTGVSEDYGKTVGWKLTAGRDFSRDFPADTNSFIVNEAAVKFMGLTTPVGTTVKWDGWPFTIIGVVDDMLMESPYSPVRPSIYCTVKDHSDYVLLRVPAGKDMQTALDEYKKVFTRYSPAEPFNYKFADQAYAGKFSEEQRIGRLAGVFATLAILICCLGLFGMASFMAEQRTREIGVRKVLGASILNIWGLLSKQFVALVSLSLLIAMPLSGWFMHSWLQGFTFRSGLPWWIFAVAGVATILITLLTVSYQAIRAAKANPVEALRSE
ncbi:MAG TPA: ABC transporter permease [Puia sp.]|jgi:ABC-type antimicrobial peptide transport system permease subunit|nr:ABC transporter permease [Puia sp.]